jgi:hypothetical protein
MVPGFFQRTRCAKFVAHLVRLGTKAQATDPTSQAGFASVYGYQEDSESGLKLPGQRYYDAGTGRFIERGRVAQ